MDHKFSSDHWLASLSSFRPEYLISEPILLLLRTEHFFFMILSMVAEHMDFDQPLYFTQLIGDISGNHYFS